MSPIWPHGLESVEIATTPLLGFLFDLIFLIVDILEMLDVYSF